MRRVGWAGRGAGHVALVVVLLAVVCASRADADINATGPTGAPFWVRASCATDTLTTYTEPVFSPQGTPPWGWNTTLAGTIEARSHDRLPRNFSQTVLRSSTASGSSQLVGWRGSTGYRFISGWVDSKATLIPTVTVEDTKACPTYRELPATTFTVVEPRRVLDTRTASAVGYSGAKPGPQTRVPVVLGSLPADTTAVALTVTVTESSAAGYVQALPGGSDQTGAWSNLNVDGPGRTVANTVVVPVGAAGDVELYTLGSAHLVADLTGVFVHADGPTSAGRFAASVANRVLDTRTTGGPVPAGGRVRVSVAGAARQPDASLVSAAVVNITATDTLAPGYVQAAAGGQLVVGATSVLAIETAGQTVAGMTIVPVASDGTIEFYTLSPTQLVIDLIGWFSSDAVDPDTNGQFVPVPPERVLDTRPRSTIGCCWGHLSTGTQFRAETPSINDILFAGLAVPTLGAVFLNVTATDSTGPGYIAADAAGDLVPGTTSLLNVPDTGATVPNAAIVPVGLTDVHTPPDPLPYDALGISLYSHAASHLVVDLFGYFT